MHSGSFGGTVANPAFVLAQILNQMKDRSGRVKVAGFYDDVRPLRDAERAEFAHLPFNERRYRTDRTDLGVGLRSVLFGVGLPGENTHAPNEKLDLTNFHNGIIASTVFYYQEIGRIL